MKPSKFNYINCTEVLHHLANPDEGLKNLKDSLKPTGVYQIQDLMKMINQGIISHIEEVIWKINFR